MALRVTRAYFALASAKRSSRKIDKQKERWRVLGVLFRISSGRHLGVRMA
jgi:hypothetical protein